MMEHHKIPDDGKQKPRDKEGGSKGAESQWPGHVDHWYEEIFQVSAKIPINASQNQPPISASAWMCHTEGFLESLVHTNLIKYDFQTKTEGKIESFFCRVYFFAFCTLVELVSFTFWFCDLFAFVPMNNQINCTHSAFQSAVILLSFL